LPHGDGDVSNPETRGGQEARLFFNLQEMTMPMVHTLLVFLILIAIIGLILWGVGQIPGIPPIVKTIAYVVVGVILLLYLLELVSGGQLSLK
jgi:hypothetical protein